MANPSILARLAVEILFSIAAHTTLSDRISLSTTSVVFNSVATKLLYRDIELTSLKRMVLCCKTLAQNSEIASAVRTLAFDHLGIGDTDGAVIPSFFRILNSALFKTTNLSSLVLLLPYEPTGIALRHCYFPLLETYASYVHDRFLQRHRRIKNITLLGGSNNPDLLPTHLPLLEVFSGSSAAAQTFIPSRPVHTAAIEWPQFPYFSLDDEEVDGWDSISVIDNLAKSAHPNGIGALSNIFVFAPPIQIFHALAASLNLTTLEIYIVPQDSQAGAYEQFLDQFTSVLLQFRSLRHLVIQTLPRPDGPATLEHPTREIALVREWGARCSTLHSCILNTFWVPNHSNSEITSRFLCKMFEDAARGGLEPFKKFFRDVWSFFFHLSPETPLFPVVFAHVLGLSRVVYAQLDRLPIPRAV
ncbi:hypothetical protein K438DRAFT_1781425 [Mycena galopus ATCC 62051]|nr:hypothetical protein K438DRAFT_1781425 [Mycena galopus ATCC 62051]